MAVEISSRAPPRLVARWSRAATWNRAAPALVVSAWALLVALVVAWGAAGGAGAHAVASAAPFVGHWGVAVSWLAIPALVIAAFALTWLPRSLAHLRWRRLLAAHAALAVGWAVALAISGGTGGLTGPLETRYEYLHWVPMVGSPGEFLRHFVGRLPHEATHIKSHPPGMVLLLWCLDRIGLGGAGAATVLILGAVAASVVAVLVALRDIAGEAAARRAAPFVALLPAAVWMATSEDAFFLGVTACGVTAIVLATSRRGRRSLLWALAGGLLLGAGLFLSYGVAALLPLPVAVVALRRRWVVLGPAAVGIAAVAVGFTLAGFWWPDGLAATHQRYLVGVAAQRSDTYFLVANLAILAVAAGPAVVVALSQLRRHPQYLLAGVTLAVLLVVDLSGLSQGEVERIWLPFVPWMATACAGLTDDLWSRRLLAFNVATGLLVQLVLRSPW